MIVIPAVDLREGACVQLVGGDYAKERVRLEDPVAVAAQWGAAGFGALHLVDLDAAVGRGTNGALLAEMIAAVHVPVQVGGGVRDDAAIERLLSIGAERVVVGTRALEEPEWLERAAHRFPGRLVVAADVRGREVLTHGWTRVLDASFDAVLGRLVVLPVAGVLVTAVHREGRLSGPDVPLSREAAGRVPWPVYASGGITSIADLRALAAVGVAGAVIGMALYTGAIDAHQAAREFGDTPSTKT
jgi:phosphoribosylformimino-5-aminoimidazole carboxamide ribotide isomerase